jgi:hypothetical protein
MQAVTAVAPARMMSVYTKKLQQYDASTSAAAPLPPDPQFNIEKLFVDLTSCGLAGVQLKLMKCLV